MQPKLAPGARRIDFLYTCIHRLGIFTIAVFFVLNPVYDALAEQLRLQGISPFNLEQLWPGVTDVPLASFFLYLFVLDFFDYWYHRASHHFNWWWGLHSLHHSQRDLNLWSDNRNHLLDDLLRDIYMALVALAIGVEPGQYVLLVAASRMLQSLQHANVRIHFGCGRRAPAGVAALPSAAPRDRRRPRVARRGQPRRPQFRGAVSSVGHPVSNRPFRQGLRGNRHSRPIAAAARLRTRLWERLLGAAVAGFAAHAGICAQEAFLMGAALLAFGRALWSQLHLRMLLLTLVPFLLSAALWGVALWLGLQPMIDWLQAWFVEHQGFGVAGRVLGWVGLGALKTVIVPLIAMWVLLPLMILTALVFVATLAVPVVVKHVSYRYYPALEQRRGGTFLGSLWTFCSSFVIFLALWLLTLPLALIPPFTLLVQPLLWGWLTYRVMAYDALAQHASAAEREAILRLHRWPLLWIGAISGADGRGARRAVAGRRAVGDLLSAAGGRRDLAVRAGIRVHRLVVPALLPGERWRNTGCGSRRRRVQKCRGIRRFT